MPHSEPTTPPAKSPMVNGINGEMSSAFISHLTSYPFIHDSLTTLQSYTLTQHSLALADKATSPILPYFKGPYAYISPYVSKADALADSVLSKVEAKFPAIKKPTGEILEIAYTPLTYGKKGKEYVFSTYGGQCGKIGGRDGVVKYGKAAVATGVVIGNDVLGVAKGYVVKNKKTDAAPADGDGKPAN